MSALLVLVTALAVEPGLDGVENGVEYVCSNGQNERRIQVIYPKGAPLPCEVHYIKGSDSQVLWRANNESGYCDARAAEFAEKQKEMYFPCTQNQ
ncbi:hypothetical protein SAMN04488540_101409 [Ferrimonas sediminum]|uniref:Uncharacterized protein n=1 Tax=Ferrimonas sediminum TaxID=718193 RepID=A0A1G8KMA0_9GAMM|nr:hypothetical protein [Ferrimonas sediminum]SDI44010.1 hypothetical protein SAMN04488540_101409 [Ferrimonas sediminum]